MKVVVIGLGSMGKRRIRLIKQLGIAGIVGVDTNVERRQKVAQEYEITCEPDLDAALARGEADAAFICTSPLSHALLIRACLAKGLHVFSELNLVPDGYAENIALAKKNNLVLFMSSTLLYREEIQRMLNAVRTNGEGLNYTYHVGQYLPDWHPWENYKDYFVSDHRTDGCREIMAIELPWLTKCFGDVKDFSVVSGKQTALEIQFPDYYSIILSHENGSHGQLLIDVATRVPVRHFEAFGQNVQIEWRGQPDQLWIATAPEMELKRIEPKEAAERREGYRAFIIENAYLKEIDAFFKTIRGEFLPEYTFADDEKTLRLIDQIQKA